MFQGMRRLPEEATKDWHGNDNEEPVYLRPLLAGVRYHILRRRFTAALPFALGFGAGHWFPLYVWAVVFGVLLVVSAVIGVMLVVNYFRMTRLTHESERGIKIVTPAVAAPPKEKEKAA